MKRTNHNCKTSRYFERMYRLQCKLTDQLQTKLRETSTMKDQIKVDLNAVNEVAIQLDELIERKERAQNERLHQFDRLEREIGDGVKELDELREMARKHAALMPF